MMSIILHVRGHYPESQDRSSDQTMYAFEPPLEELFLRSINVELLPLSITAM